MRVAGGSTSGEREHDKGRHGKDSPTQHDTLLGDDDGLIGGDSVTGCGGVNEVTRDAGASGIVRVCGLSRHISCEACVAPLDV